MCTAKEIDISSWKVITRKRNRYKEKKTLIKPDENYPNKSGVILFNKELNKIVLIQNKYLHLKGIKKFGLPKGHVNNNETYENCAIRETFEETGIKLNKSSLIFKIKISNTYYFPIILNKEVVLSPVDTTEVQDAKWILIDNIKDYNINRETKTFINRKLDVIKAIILKYYSLKT